jgi:hypothetical protein
VRRYAVEAAVLLLAVGCAQPPFEGGRYSFDGTPPIHREGIVSITLDPIPEGPTAPVFVMNPRSVEHVREELDLATLLPHVPDPLPATIDQGDCEFGGDLVVVTNDGATIAYGPCLRPPSINRLWARFIEIISNGACRPNCGPVEPTGE